MHDTCYDARVQCAIWRALRLVGVRLDTPGAQDVARSLTWIIAQQPMILTRFPVTQNDEHTLEGLDTDSYWAQKLHKFLSRADILTFESPQGRQAVAEFSATTIGLMASVWRQYGPPDIGQASTSSSHLVKPE